MKRIILVTVLLASFAWIAYFSFDLLSIKNKMKAEELFGIDDSYILVVNRQSEIIVNTIEELGSSPVKNVYLDLKDSTFDVAYLSAARPHALFIKKSGWNSTDIKNLFSTLEVKELIESKGTFSIGEFSGKFFKQGLYISKGDIDYTNSYNTPFTYDKKASGAVIGFESGETPSITDIYFKSNGRFDFITRNPNLKQGKQIRDEELFAHFISDKVTSFHFYERDYYSLKDSLFKTGPLYGWMDKGFIIAGIGDKKAIISDYILGQDPVLILNDAEQNDSSEIYHTKLLKDFPAGDGYYIDYLEDLVVISEDKGLVDQLIVDYKLGHTIALNEQLNNRIYGNLPHNVSERLINNSNAISRSVYNGYLLMTKADFGVQDQKSVKKQNFSMNIGSTILDFATLKGEGNVAVIDNKNILSFFKNGSKAWEKNLNEKGMNLSVIDMYANGHQQILIQTSDQIHLLDSEGNYLSGFPLKISQEITSPVQFYRWKNQGYLLAGTADGKVRLYDGQAREINVINSTIVPKRKIDTWSSQGRLFYGITDNNEFVMYDATKRKIHRRFPLKGEMIAARIPNELLQFGVINNSLVKIDQKGTASNLDSYPNGKIMKLEDGNKNPVMAIKINNSIKLINSEGISFGNLTLPFNEIGNIDFITNRNGKTIVAVIDGLENNVYLYSLEGSKITDKPLEGQLKVVLEESNDAYKITTVVDQFIVQYYEN